MEHATPFDCIFSLIEDLSIQELKNLRGLVNKEIDSRMEMLAKKETKMTERGYTLYLQIVNGLGPKSAALEMTGWGFGQYLKYMKARNPENNLDYLMGILVEEADSRNKVWLANRNLQSQHAPYVSLTHVYEPK